MFRREDDNFSSIEVWHRLLLITLFIFGTAIFFWDQRGIATFNILKSHQTVVYAYTSEAQTLDPALAKDPQSAKVISCVYEGLVRYKQGTLDIEPALASDWEITDDGLVYMFNLKKNILFHDGSAFNAHAVKYSIDRQFTNNKQSYYFTLVFGPLKEVQIVNDYTIKILLSKPYAPLLQNLAMPYAAPIISPTAAQKYGSAFGVNPVGTGPYIFEDWDKGNIITLGVNPFYREQGPQINKLLFKAVPQAGQRLAGLIKGDIHLADGFTQQHTEMLRQKNIPYLTTASTDISYLGFYVNKPPFNNVKLRQAVSMAINRNLPDEGNNSDTNANQNILPPGVSGFDQNLIPYPYNNEKALQLLSKEGAEVLNFELLTYKEQRPYNSSGGEMLARYIQNELARINITVDIKSYSWVEYKKALLEQEGDAFLYGWISDSGDPDDILYHLLGSTQNSTGLNMSHYCNSIVDSLLEQGRQCSNLQQRHDIYSNIQKLVLQDAPLIPLNHSLHILAVSPVIQNCILQRNGTCFLNELR